MATSREPFGWMRRWGPVVVWMGIIFAASALPARQPTPGLSSFRWDDKLQHSAAYAILAALVWRALGPAKPRWWRLGVTVLFAVAYGTLDEYHQSLVPGRECSISDWATDSFGAAAAALVLNLWKGGDSHVRRAESGESIRGQGQEAGKR